MSQQGEAAEQIVNMATNVTVKGVECMANLTGKGALSLATFLVAALKDEKRTSGKVRMRAFHGKPTAVFVIHAKDMKIFAEEAKKYGVLYAAVINKKQPNGLIDVVVNANDAARVNRIAERFALSTVDVEKIRADIEKTRAEKAGQSGTTKERTTPPAEKNSRDSDNVTAEEKSDGNVARKTAQKQQGKVSGNATNPTMAGTGKSIPFAPFSKSKSDFAEADINERASVREQIKEIRNERQSQQQPAHQPPKKKTKSKER